MRARYDIFNAVGVVTAGLLFIIALQVRIGHSYRPVILLAAGMFIMLIGGGSLINLANRGLLDGPTKAVIFAYALSLALIPFAVWGYVLWKQEHRRLYRPRKPQAPPVKR